MKKLLVLFFLALVTPAFSQIYSRVGSYHDGLALVSGYTSANGYSKKYGYVNEYNKLVIPLKYEYAEGFERGTAVVGIGVKYGVIKKNGQVMVPIKYDGIARFGTADGTELFVVRDNRGLGCIDKNGKLIIPCEYSCYAHVGVDANLEAKSTQYIAMLKGSYPDEKWYLFDPHNGKPVLPQGGYMRAGFNRLTAREGEHYLWPSSIYPINGFEVDGKIGLYDFVNERVQVEPIYSTIEARYKGDYYIVGEGTYKGVIDKTGKMIIPMEYEFILFGTESKFLSIEVRKDGEIGYYDGKGNVLAPLGSKEQEKGGYQLISYRGKYGLKNYSKWLLFMDFDSIVLGNNSIAVMRDGKYGLVSQSLLERDWPKGKEILVYDDIVYVKDGGFLCKKDGKWGLESQEPPFMFDSIVSENGCLKVKRFGKWGIYPGTDSKEIVYYDTKPVGMADGNFCVINNGKAGVIRKDDFIIVPFDFDDVLFLYRDKGAYESYTAYYAVKRNGKWALCENHYDLYRKDAPRMEISDFDFDEIRGGGCEVFPMRVGENWGFVYWGNDNGKRKALTIKAKYDEVGPFYSRKALVRKGNKQFYIDRHGKKVK